MNICTYIFLALVTTPASMTLATARLMLKNTSKEPITFFINHYAVSAAMPGSSDQAVKSKGITVAPGQENRLEMVEVDKNTDRGDSGRIPPFAVLVVSSKSGPVWAAENAEDGVSQKAMWTQLFSVYVIQQKEPLVSPVKKPCIVEWRSHSSVPLRLFDSSNHVLKRGKMLAAGAASKQKSRDQHKVEEEG